METGKATGSTTIQNHEVHFMTLYFLYLASMFSACPGMLRDWTDQEVFVGFEKIAFEAVKFYGKL